MYNILGLIKEARDTIIEFFGFAVSSNISHLFTVLLRESLFKKYERNKQTKLAPKNLCYLRIAFYLA